MSDEKHENVDDDFEYSRRTYYDLIEKGQGALEEMMEVAKQLEHPRAFEVVSGMIKNISDVNDRLMDLHKKKKDYNKKDIVKPVDGTTNNNLFVGSTVELQRMLQDMNKEQDNVIDITDRLNDEPK
ncbi:MAG TPA: hypothetical protein DCW93_01410 [Saprospirales bacterium]|jgi:hypothetical protein|nr:hypothetical protein [Saprospirales bacterium]